MTENTRKQPYFSPHRVKGAQGGKQRSGRMARIGKTAIKRR